jgi:hypothetical protein
VRSPFQDDGTVVKPAVPRVQAAKEYSFHPISNMFPLLEGGEFAALVEDIRAHGLQQEIILYEGQILDGRNRYRACLQTGVEPRFREMLFGSYADAVAYAIGANIHRRHLTAEERRKIIEQLLKANPEQSDRQIARTARVSDKTVGAVRNNAEARAEIPHVENRTDSKGRSQPARKAGAKSKTTTPSAHFTVAGNDVDTAASAEARRAEFAELEKEWAAEDTERDHADADHAGEHDGDDELDTDALRLKENYDRVFKELIDAVEHAFDSLADLDDRESLSTDLDDWLRTNHWRVVGRRVPPPRAQGFLKRKGLVCDPATLKLVPAPKPEADDRTIPSGAAS